MLRARFEIREKEEGVRIANAFTRKGETRAPAIVEQSGSEGVVNKRYSRRRYPILRLLSFGIC